MSVDEHIKSNCGRLPYGRIRMSRFDRLELAGISRGVLFVLAAWSGHSVQSFRLFCDALAEAPDATLPIFVVDADDFNFDAFASAFGELPQGKGEAYWIRNGQVLHLALLLEAHLAAQWVTTRASHERSD